MKLILIALCYLIVSLASISRAATLPLKKGEAFVLAKSKLHSAGWRADPHSHAGVGEYFGVDRRLIEGGFDEVDYCSLGKTFCVFQYKRAQSCLRMHTEGEQITAMRVVSWSSECRARASDEIPILLPAEVRFLLQRRGECEQFGDCDGIDAYSRKVEKKYARNREIMKALQFNARQTPDSRK